MKTEALLSLQDLIHKLQEIKRMGFVKTRRAHDTGVGKTLEDLLEIRENNIQLPDLGDVELKAKRTDSGSMLTIATKSPEPRGVNKVLFEHYKYKDSHGVDNLHSTVYGSRVNPQGFKIDVVDNRLYLRNKNNIEAYWPMSIFDDVLKSKSKNIVLVLAETKGKRKTMSEYFHYTEAYLLPNLNMKKLLGAITNGDLKIDIRIGCYRSGSRRGEYHDHGTGFRIHKRDYPKIFDGVLQLI